MRIVWGSKYEERAIMPTFFAILFDIFFMCSFQVKKLMHWFVCLLHTNELPLRHLLVHLDGITHGPNSFSGTIGKQLKDSDMPVVTFQRIEGNVLRNIDPNELSIYLKCVRQLMLPIWAMQHRFGQPKTRINVPFSMVNNGQSDTSIVYFERKFRQIFVNYIVKVYATIWFEIKSKPSFTDGSHHPFRMIPDRGHPFMTSTQRGGGGQAQLDACGRGEGRSRPMWTSTQKIKIRVH